jgi:hypothetical protein
MMVYRKKSTQPLKWIVALVIFAVVLGFTLDEVDGFNIPGQSKDSTQQDVNAAPPGGSNQSSQSVSRETRVDPPETNSPEDISSVPEPGTLLLIASGLGAMYLMRRRKA